MSTNLRTVGRIKSMILKLQRELRDKDTAYDRAIFLEGNIEALLWAIGRAELI